MRYFNLCVSLFVAFLIVTKALHAQSEAVVSMETGTYNLDAYRKDFKTGYTKSSGVTEIRGQLFRPIPGNTLFEGYPGIELTLDAGADFSQQVVTGANGTFTFADVPVGSFTIFAQNTETNAFGSVTILLSGERIPASGLSDFSTDFDVDTLKLLFTDKELYILGETQNMAELVQPVEGVDTVAEMAAATGSAAGFAGGGDMGMFGAALGVAGLATGIAALASGGGHGGGGRGGYGGGRDNNWVPPRPVTVGSEGRPNFGPRN